MVRSVSRLMRRQWFVVPPGRRDDLIDQPRRRAICQDMVACLTLTQAGAIPKMSVADVNKSNSKLRRS